MKKPKLTPKVIQVINNRDQGWGIFGLGDDSLMYVWNYKDACWDLLQRDFENED